MGWPSRWNDTTPAPVLPLLSGEGSCSGGPGGPVPLEAVPLQQGGSQMWGRQQGFANPTPPTEELRKPGCKC